MQMRLSDSSLDQRRIGIAIGLGALGGLVFALATWGYDFAILVIAHGLLPWSKFLLGVVIAVLSGSLCGYVCSKTSRLFLVMVLWLIWGFFMSWVAGQIPFEYQTRMIHTFYPLLQQEISYPQPQNEGPRIFLVWLITGGLTLIISFLFINLVDSVTANTHIGTTVLFVLVWLLFFGFVGKSIDSIYNQSFRDAIQVTHQAIQNTRTHLDLLDNGSEASKLHIIGMRPLRGVINRPYWLVVKSYDPTFESVDVLVDLDGFWYTCNVFINQVNICK
jgi:hypothetical protein